MDMMEIVAKYRPLYREVFMQPSLSMLPGTEIKLPLFTSDIVDFGNSWIILDYSSPQSRHVWGANNVDIVHDDVEATIHITKEMAGETIEKRKFVLAHEWLEVLYFTVNRERFGNRKLGKKIDMVILYELLKRPSPWQDTPEQWEILHLALRQLLVSAESIRELLENDFSVTLDEFRHMIGSSRTRAAELFNDAVKLFSAKWSVTRDLVGDRLQELLYLDA